MRQPDATTITEVIRQMKLRTLTTSVVMGILVCAGIGGTMAHPGKAAVLKTYSSTSVSLYRPFPNGIDSTNPQHALQQVQSRAAWDPSYANTIAQQAGRPSYVASEYRAEGFALHASPGTTNSGVTGNGVVVPVADHNGSQNVKVFLMINIVSQKTVELMVRCGNPRLRPSVSVVVIPWKPFSKGTVIRFNRRVSKPVSITCPSGQTVSGTLTTTVSGFTQASTWGKVQGNLNLKLRAKLKISVKSWVTLHCGPSPTTPTPTKAPITLGKVCVDPSGNVEPFCPSGTFKFQITADGLTYLETYNPSSNGQMVMPFGCTPGSSVTYTEVPTDGWTVLFPAGGTITVTCNQGTGAFAAFKNQEQGQSPPSSPPPSGGGTVPKSNEDLCTNIPGTQTAVPAGYQRNPDGTCTYVGP